MNVTRILLSVTVIAVQFLTMNWTSSVNASELASAEYRVSFGAEFRSGLPTSGGAIGTQG